MAIFFILCFYFLIVSSLMFQVSVRNVKIIRSYETKCPSPDGPEASGVSFTFFFKK